MDSPGIITAQPTEPIDKVKKLSEVIAKNAEVLLQSKELGEIAPLSEGSLKEVQSRSYLPLSLSSQAETYLSSSSRDTGLMSPEALKALTENLKIYKYTQKATSSYTETGNPLRRVFGDVNKNLIDILEIKNASSGDEFEKAEFDSLFAVSRITPEMEAIPYEERFNNVVSRARPNMKLFYSLMAQGSEETRKLLMTYYMDQYINSARANHEVSTSRRIYRDNLVVPDSRIKKLSGEIYSDFLNFSLHYHLRNNDTASVDNVLRNLFNYGDVDIATKVLLDKSLDPKLRKTFAISYINTFGFITFTRLIESEVKKIGTIKTKAELFGETDFQPKDIEKLKLGEEIEKLYFDLNNIANDHQKILSSVADFYSDDFVFEIFKQNYTLETLKAELISVKNALGLLGQGFKGSRILDLAAGAGRISKAMLGLGASEVISVDVVPEFIEAMEQERLEREKNPKYRGGKWRIETLDWKNLRDLVFRMKKPDVGVCLGRSLPHANCMEDFVTVMSQMTAIGMPDVWVFDYPDSDEGYYAEKSRAYKQHLANQGIDYRSMNLVYDGIDNTQRLHRMFTSQEQVEAVLKLVGFEVEDIKIETEKTSYSDRVNKKTFTIRRNPNFKIEDLSQEEVVSIFKTLDFFKPGTNLNLLLPPPVNLTLAQILYLFEEKNIESDHHSLLKDFRRENKDQINSLTWEFAEDGKLHLLTTQDNQKKVVVLGADGYRPSIRRY